MIAALNTTLAPRLVSQARLSLRRYLLPGCGITACYTVKVKLCARACVRAIWIKLYTHLAGKASKREGLGETITREVGGWG